MDEILIEKVREHEVLYDHGSPDYRDQHIRQTAWEEIGRELQITGNKAKERWDKLRRCFCNARNRRRDDTKSGMASKRKTPWKYELQMSFIIPYLESRKTHSNLKESQVSVNLATESEDISEESEAEEENAHRQSERGQIDLDIESERGTQDNQAADDEASNDAEIIEKRYEAVKLLRNKKRKQRIDTPAHQMIQILKETSDLRKRQYEEKSMRPVASKTTSLLETLDDTDMFFLSMSRMTKQLPKVEQAQIKLALSNSVLSAEVRCNQQSAMVSSPHYNTPQHSFHPVQVQSCLPSPSPAGSMRPMTSSSDYSQEYSQEERIFTRRDYSQEEREYSNTENYRPTLLEMVSLPQSQYK